MQTLNKFAKLSILFGVVSILLYSTVIVPLIFGGLGLIFAELSKEGEKKMSTGAVLGGSMCGLILAVTVISGCYSVYMFKTDDAYRDKVNKAFSEVYGVTIDENFNVIGSTSGNNLQDIL